MAAKPTGAAALNERAQYLLRVLVERYIRDGAPVGSRTLARDSGLELSPATIRNVMADLEEMGLVRSPHTSAGRVPTVQGYRVFVDTLLTVRPLDSAEALRMRHELDPEQGRKHLVEAASTLLSDITHLAGIVSVPRKAQERLRQVEFLPLSDTQILVILVTNEREVQNRIIRTARGYSAAELQQAANYLNAKFGGRDLVQLRAELVRDLREAREHVNRIMLTAIEVAEHAFAPPEGDDELMVAGQTNLMEYGDFSDIGQLRDLFDAFNRKRDILHLLDQAVHASGVQIFIGEESGYDVLDACSVVTSPYRDENGQILGVLGVIGPTRMAYERVIPVVDLTARLLGAALNPRH